MKSIHNIESLAHLLRKTGLYSPENTFYPERERKYHQALAYIKQLNAAFKKLSSKRPLVLLDACCGRSYVSFILYAYCQDVLKRPIKIIGVDRNAALIEQNRKIAEELGFLDMIFYIANIHEFETTKPIDIVYSLHACDTATDYVIATGIKREASYIFSVSCCQHTNSRALKRHPLHTASRFRPFKERIADMLGDTQRALLLESHGYEVKIFEFVGTAQTQKNIMLRGVRNGARRKDIENARRHYKEIADMF